MGMYDEIQCDATLPDGYKGTGARFQTKSFRTLECNATKSPALGN
jgi:hypothetical protein